MADWLRPVTLLSLASLARSQAGGHDGAQSSSTVDVRWHPPAQTPINNLTAAMSQSGVYGFIFDSSHTPDDKYGTYNWCNMPHVRRTEYAKPEPEYELQYVEVIHRHHKRTPYASNAFPVEPYKWNCDDQALFYYGAPLSSTSSSHEPAHGYWKVDSPPMINPFIPSGWIGTCQFPQITAPGLEDSWQHGADLYGVYHDLLGLLPGRDEDWRSKVLYRVTNNVITSQMVGMVINGMWGATDTVPLSIQASGIDSLEPQYSCPTGAALFSTIRSAANPAWTGHLTTSAALFATLDAISGVPPSDSGFHVSWDHYYDNLSARQCHAKPLPCQLVDGANSSTCVTQDMANTVYRLGQWEYSQIFRDSPLSLAASVSTYGVWVAELAAHLRDVIEGRGGERVYVHNVAHDGSVSRLLGVLQVDEMVWPGMGAEVVFELWKKKPATRREAVVPGEQRRMEDQKRAAEGEAKKSTKEDQREEHGKGAWFMRVLFGGQVLKSSSPTLGLMDMVPAEKVLAYFDGLVGPRASLMKGKCSGAIPSPRRT